MIYAAGGGIIIEEGDRMTVDSENINLLAVPAKNTRCGRCYFHSNNHCYAEGFSCGFNRLVPDTKTGNKEKNEEGIIILLYKSAEHLQREVEVARNKIISYEKEVKRYQKMIETLMSERNFALDELVNNKGGKHGEPHT